MDFKIQDKALMWYRKEYDKHKVTLMDEIEDIKGRFDYEELKDYKHDLSRFKRESQKAIQLNILTPYQQYMAKKWLVASKIKARDMLLWYLIYKYAYFNYLTKELEKVVFDKVNKHFVEETIKQCKEITGKDYKIDYKKLTEEALQEHNNMGYIWDKYKNTLVEFNANEMYNRVVVDLKNDEDKIKEILDRQENRLVKPNLLGTLDNEVDYITSYSQLQIFNKFGIKKVRVMGILDEKTCNICDEFIGREFKIEDIVIGEQISSHINCRCYLVPEKGE